MFGLIQREARYSIYERARNAGIDPQMFVLDAPIDVRWQRVQRRNEEQGTTSSMVAPQHIFESASKLWQAPGEAEIFDHGIQFVATSVGQNGGNPSTERTFSGMLRVLTSVAHVER